MKKIISISLIVVLVISSATFAFAATPPGLAEKGGLPPGIAKKFLDVDGYNWAIGAIERMAEKGVIKGVGEGKFAPARAVTKLEAIVMALRVMGEETKAQEYEIEIEKGKVKFDLKDTLQEWAYGYVKLAEEKGILDEADMTYFKLNEPATRHEVAKYLVRAMGYENEAIKYMNADLDYKDAALIPQGSVGYIYIANQEGIITGYPDETFKPFDLVTRAEMAVMVARLEGEVVEDDEDDEDDEVEDRRYRGIVTSVATNKFSMFALSYAEKIIEFTIDNSFEIEFEDGEGSIEDLRAGHELRVLVEDNKVTKIVVNNDRDASVLYGRLDAIYETEEQILVYLDSAYKTYSLDEDVAILLNLEDADLEDLKKDDMVVFKLDTNNEVIQINSYR